jgi:hypothetical protein
MDFMLSEESWTKFNAMASDEQITNTVLVLKSTFVSFSSFGVD